ncbi:hypothetical protein [Ligilactobacillus salivarius]|uniref:hypothetical protein n=1 Tax=Ligilactobacillus salivarius TaxID=1624 RepID=UPI0009DB2680|nr:hypothetical protein [Ligilactobacillus salivarius]OQR18442.1 hypothetical protein B6U39_10900 [Ligilactobacillus salivarius]
MLDTIIIIAISALVPVVIGGLFLSEIVRKATRRDKKYYLSVYGTIVAMVISTLLLYEVYKLVFNLLVKAYTSYAAVEIPTTFIVVLVVWFVIWKLDK